MVEILVVHIIMIICMIKYRHYRRKYQSLKDLKKFKDFVAKEIPDPAETLDMEQQSDESCFENNGYLSIIKIVEKEIIKEIPVPININSSSNMEDIINLNQVQWCRVNAKLLIIDTRFVDTLKYLFKVQV